MEITEIILGQVIGKANNYKVVPDLCGSGRIIKSEALRQYEQSFIEQCKIYKNRNICSRFVLHIIVFCRSNVYDLDNSLKTILDCLQYVGAIKDDNLCVEIHAAKRIDRYSPRIEFRIEELEPMFFK